MSNKLNFDGETSEREDEHEEEANERRGPGQEDVDDDEYG